MLLALAIFPVYLATMVSTASDTLPRSVPWTLADTSKTGWTL